MASNALSLATWLPDIETQTPNPGDVVEVLQVPVNATPITQFTAVSGGTGGGGGAALPRATAQGQLVMSGAGPQFLLTVGDLDGSRY